uniref:Uncharacterized protein n=1 Tax=viral metagenome TaxID=1070528 RepID=A0A6M3J360_9ZZZZ
MKNAFVQTTDYHFFSNELQRYQYKIHLDSVKIIDNIIKKFSPIQVDENVETIDYGKEPEMLRVTKIELMAVDSWGAPGQKLSFRYEGMPLSKTGKPMKNRKPKWFGAFRKDGKYYDCPSYNRIKIVPAKMFNSY